jgi:protein-tyrosine-phosphatase
MQELGISMSGHRSKGLADVPIQEIDLVVSFGDAHKQLSDLPRRAKIERWLIAPEPRSATAAESAVSSVRDRRDEIDKRVFALFLDYWRNVPQSS